MNQAHTATAQHEAQQRRNDTEGHQPRNWSLIAIVLVVATALRLYRLGADSLWDNEILSHRRATAGLRDAYDLIREGTHPPGYSQLVLRPWLALGDSEFMQRVPSVVFGVAAIAITAALAHRLAGPRAGLAAAALSTVMPLHLYYSREGRMYALLALVLVAWIAALIHAHERDTWRAWALYTALGGAALYTQYYAGFTVLSVVAVTAAFEYRAGLSDRTRRWFIATAGIGVVFLPWMPTFLYQLRNDPVSHLEALSVRGVAELPVMFFTAFADRSAIDNLVVAAALAFLTGVAVRTLWNGRSSHPDNGFAAAVIVGAVVGTIALSVAISVLRPLIFVRYFVGILPMVAVMLAVPMGRLRFVTSTAFAALIVVSVVHAIPTIDDTWRPAFGAATDRIEAAGPDDSIVLLVGADASDFRVSGFWYYLDAAHAVIDVPGQVSDPTFTDAIDQLSEDIDRVWVVQYQRIGAVATPDGFAVASTERLDSRFFTRTYPVSVVELERTDP